MILWNQAWNGEIHIIVRDGDWIIDDIGTRQQIRAVLLFAATDKRATASVGAIIAFTYAAGRHAWILASGYPTSFLNTSKLLAHARLTAGYTTKRRHAGEGAAITPTGAGADAIQTRYAIHIKTVG